MKRFLIGFCTLVLLWSCGGNDDPPPSPEGANLIFPLESSECTTGVSVSETLSQVTFEWSASAKTDSYRLIVVNLTTNIQQQPLNTAATTASISIEKGTPYSWSVTSVNSSSGLTATSDTWLFYNAGSQTTYAPFPAQLVSPASGATVQKSLANEVVLQWMGADVDNDLNSFEVFFSDQNPPTTAVGTTNATTMEYTATVSSNTIYYWKVVSTDSEGNTSDSGVFEFKVF